MRRLSILVLAAAVGGCDSDGTVREEVPELTAVPSTTFGDQQGEGALSSVFGLAISEKGKVFLSEPQFARVVRFNPDGTFAGVVGQRGNGPGEFQAPGRLSWRGDSLAVTDFQKGIHLFSPDGDFARLIAFHINDGSTPFGVRPIFPLSDGFVAALAPPSTRQITEGFLTQETWLKASRDGTTTDTLAVVPLDGRYFTLSYEDAERLGAHPLSWATLIAAPPSGTSLILVDRPASVQGDATVYRVLRVGLDGDTLNTVSLSYSPVPLLAGQIDSIALEIAQGWAERMNATPPALAAAIADQIVWPSFQPPVTGVLCGSDGSVWLRRELVGASSARWDVLGPDLSRVGHVSLPLGLELKSVALDQVYGVELDAVDVPRVVRFNIRRQ